MRKLSIHERMLIAGSLVLLLLLGIKSYWLDPWGPADAEEALWMAAAQEALMAEAPSWYHQRGILSDRIVDIREVPGAAQDAPPVLKATIRSYVLGYLPFGDRKLTLTDH